MLWEVELGGLDCFKNGVICLSGLVLGGGYYDSMI